MALKKLALLPDSNGYVVREGNDAIFTRLDGGLGRYRLDVLGASKTLDCQWSLDRSSYAYLRAFYKTAALLSGTKFLIDLIIDDSEIEEHVAYFEPGSLQLTEQKGLLYVVNATLEVKPILRTEGYDELLVAIFESYGEDYVNEYNSVAQLLETLMNVTLPAI